ncbi:MAG: DUF2961 domain-containing protein [Candidatus Eisenbacteria bacterium]
MARLPSSFAAWFGFLALLLVAAGCGGGGQDVDVWEFLDGDLSGLAELSDARSVLFSSYDRTGGNDDGFSGLFSRIRIDENGEHVLAEMDGPGCVKRIWMTWPGRSTRIRIYIDGEETPALDLPIEELFSGEREPFLAPFVGGDRRFGGVNFSYIPIPFAKSIRITTADGIRFYQINAHAYPEGTRLKSFTFPPGRSDLGRLAGAREAIAALPDTATMEMPWTVEVREGDEVIEFTAKLYSQPKVRMPGRLLTEDLPKGATTMESLGQFRIDRPGTILELRISLEPSGCEWFGVHLLAWWDGIAKPDPMEKSPSVILPLAEVFGSAFALVDLRSAAVLSRGSTGVLRLPMPLRSARIGLSDVGSGAVTARVRILFRPSEVPEDGPRFHAMHAGTATNGNDPFDSSVPSLGSAAHQAGRALGRGHYVGTLLSAHGGAIASFLEGDETVVVDGDTAAALRGTGTEDYFNSGWYFAGPSAPLPFSGVSFKREDPAPRVSAYRWHLSDRIAFDDSLSFRFEIGDGAIEPGTEYSTVAFWYQQEPHVWGVLYRQDERGSRYHRVVVYPRHMVSFLTFDDKPNLSEYWFLDDSGVRGASVAGGLPWRKLTDEWRGKPDPTALYGGWALGSEDQAFPLCDFPSAARADTVRFKWPGGLPEGRYAVSLVYAKGPGLGKIEARIEDRTILDPVDCAADSLEPVVVSPGVSMVLGGEELIVDFHAEPAPLTEPVDHHRRWSAASLDRDDEWRFSHRGRETERLRYRKLAGLVSGVLLTPTEPPIDRWLVAGPFDDWACTMFDTAYAPEKEHEAAGVNREAVYHGLGGAEVRWTEARADSLGFVDLREAVGPGTHRIAYAVTWVHSPRARSALFSFGSDDGAMVWLNGMRIHRWPVHRGWEDDQDRFTGELIDGWNEVLVKVEQGIAGWGYSLRLSDARAELVFSTAPD